MSATMSYLLLCAYAFVIQTISAACWGPNALNPAWSAPLGGEPLGLATNALPIETPLSETTPYAAGAPFIGAGRAGYGSSVFPVAASNGGGFAVSSVSPIAPLGVSIASENAIEGILAVGGELPFLGTVSLEGALPTTGTGTVSYGCGNGAVGMVSEDIAPLATGLPFAGAGYGYGPTWNGGLGWAGRGSEVFGCGCGAVAK